VLINMVKFVSKMAGYFHVALIVSHIAISPTNLRHGRLVKLSMLLYHI